MQGSQYRWHNQENREKQYSHKQLDKLYKLEEVIIRGSHPEREDRWNQVMLK